MNYKEELEKIEKTVSDNKLEQVRLQERKKRLEEEKNKILEELKKEEITEEELNDKIMNLEIEIQESIDTIKEVLK